MFLNSGDVVVVVVEVVAEGVDDGDEPNDASIWPLERSIRRTVESRDPMSSVSFGDEGESTTLVTGAKSERT